MKPKTKEEVEIWIIAWLQDNAGVTSESIDLNKPFADYHLDSLTSIELSYDLEEWTGKELTVTTAWNYPTINKMSEYLAGVKDNSKEETSIDSLLNEIEKMTEEEVNQDMGST